MNDMKETYSDIVNDLVRRGTESRDDMEYLQDYLVFREDYPDSECMACDFGLAVAGRVKDAVSRDPLQWHLVGADGKEIRFNDTVWFNRDGSIIGPMKVNGFKCFGPWREEDFMVELSGGYEAYSSDVFSTYEAASETIVLSVAREIVSAFATGDNLSDKRVAAMISRCIKKIQGIGFGEDN